MMRNKSFEFELLQSTYHYLICRPFKRELSIDSLMLTTLNLFLWNLEHRVDFVSSIKVGTDDDEDVRLDEELFNVCLLLPYFFYENKTRNKWEEQFKTN